MPHTSRASFIAIALLIALTACSRGERDASGAATEKPEGAAHPASAVPTSSGDSTTSAATPDAPMAPNPRAPATYTCDNGSTIRIADLVAVVTRKDGRTVQIARDPDDAFHFQGEALSFRMKDGQGELAQDEGATSRCTGG